MVQELLTQAWFVLILSIAATILVFPLVFFMSFIHSLLKKRFKNTPEILLMLFTTFVGVLVAVVLIEIYLDYTLPQLVAALGE